MSCDLPVTLTQEALPNELPLPRLNIGAVTSVQHVVVAIIGEPVDALTAEMIKLLRTARDLQAQRRPVLVELYADTAIVTGAHRDFAAKFPGDLGVEPWRLQSYSTLLELTAMLITDLVENSARSTRTPGRR